MYKIKATDRTTISFFLIKITIPSLRKSHPFYDATAYTVNYLFIHRVQFVDT